MQTAFVDAMLALIGNESVAKSDWIVRGKCTPTIQLIRGSERVEERFVNEYSVKELLLAELTRSFI